MGRDVLSVRQMMVLLAVALLAPATDLLPTLAARQVGRGGWLVVIGAFPLLLAAFWVAAKVFCGRGICVQLGKPMGYIIIIMYMVWVLIVLAAAFRLSMARMEVIGSGVPSVPLALALAAVAVWMGTGKAAALARAAEIFYLALSVILVGVLILAAFNVEAQSLYPPEWRAIPYGGVTAAGVLLNVVPAAVLGQRVPQRSRSGRRACGWVAAFCVAITLVLVAVIGSVGSSLSARLDIPYLIMVQGLGIKGAFQRTEALVAAIWMLSDLVLAAGMVRAWYDYTQELHPGKWGKWSAMPAAAAALIGGWILLPEGEDVRRFCGGVLPITGIILGLVIPLILALILRARRAKHR